MKIPKKHAVALLHFIVEYIQQEFWPADESGAIFMSRILGFGTYHNLLTIDKSFKARIDKIGLPPLPSKRLCARLEVLPGEADAFMEMYSEYIRLGGEGDFESLRRYLFKELCCAEN